MRLVVYGSFNCPYSLLASRRVDRLIELGIADVEWRAVVHDPNIPLQGEPVVGKLAALLDRELAEIRGLLYSGETYEVRLPTVQPSTALAVAGFSIIPSNAADRLRVKLFDALWVHGFDIGDAHVLGQLGVPTPSLSGTAEQWRNQWLGFDRPLVPILVLADGTVSRGLSALKRLADFARDGAPDQ
jgi:predicted DsbA family dithiol-disulfide isomerase